MKGRKRIFTDEQRAARAAAAVTAWKAKHKNMSVDADLVDDLNDAADRLEAKFGFRPTLSQALRYLIKQFNSEK